MPLSLRIAVARHAQEYGVFAGARTAPCFRMKLGAATTLLARQDKVENQVNPIFGAIVVD